MNIEFCFHFKGVIHEGWQERQTDSTKKKLQV